MAIYIASHKHCDLVVPQGFRPLFVGAARHSHLERRDDWCYDDVGDNISSENDTYCELTGLYWLWKHCDDPFIGLVHYRRYLADPVSGMPLDEVAIEAALDQVDCLVTQKYWPSFRGTSSSIAEQFRLCHSSIDLVILRDIIEETYPSYLGAFDACLLRKWLYACNIAVLRRDLLDRYCSFLFGVLARLSEVVDPRSHRDAYQRRLFGFLGERLLNVFIEAHDLRVTEFSMCNPMEGTDFVDVAPPCPDRAEVPDFVGKFKPRRNRKSYRRVFDAKFYLEHNPDLYEMFGADAEVAFQHFFNLGLDEGRQAHPRFSIVSYMNAHPELKKVLGDEDREAWCDYYLSHWRRELFSFGFENYEFGEHPWIIEDKRVLRALRKANSQGVLD